MNNNHNKINNNNKIRDKNEINNINIIINENNNNHNSINTTENTSNKFLDKYTVEYIGDNNDIYIAMKEEKVEDKMIIQKNKNLKLSPKTKKKINLKGFFNTEKEKEKNHISNSPTNTISTAPSPIVTSNNSGNPIISVKNEKNNGDWILTSCHEIILSFINKKK